MGRKRKSIIESDDDDDKPPPNCDDPEIFDKEASEPESEPLSEDEYEVEKILTHDYRTAEHKHYYFVHWKGWTDDHNEWVPEENMGCPDLIKAYKERLKVKQSNVADSEIDDFIDKDSEDNGTTHDKHVKKKGRKPRRESLPSTSSAVKPEATDTDDLAETGGECSSIASKENVKRRGRPARMGRKRKERSSPLTSSTIKKVKAEQREEEHRESEKKRTEEEDTVRARREKKREKKRAEKEVAEREQQEEEKEKKRAEQEAVERERQEKEERERVEQKQFEEGIERERQEKEREKKRAEQQQEEEEEEEDTEGEWEMRRRAAEQQREDLESVCSMAIQDDEDEQQRMHIDVKRGPVPKKKKRGTTASSRLSGARDGAAFTSKGSKNVVPKDVWRDYLGIDWVDMDNFEMEEQDEPQYEPMMPLNPDKPDDVDCWVKELLDVDDNGFTRGWPVESVIGVSEAAADGTQQCFVKFVGFKSPQKIPMAVVKEKAPEAFIQWFTWQNGMDNLDKCGAYWAEKLRQPPSWMCRQSLVAFAAWKASKLNRNNNNSTGDDEEDDDDGEHELQQEQMAEQKQWKWAPQLNDEENEEDDEDEEEEGDEDETETEDKSDDDDDGNDAHCQIEDGADVEDDVLF